MLFNWKGCQRQHPDLGWTQSSPTFIRDKWKALKLAWQASTDDPTVPSRLLTQCFCDVVSRGPSAVRWQGLRRGACWWVSCR